MSEMKASSIVSFFLVTALALTSAGLIGCGGNNKSEKSQGEAETKTVSRAPVEPANKSMLGAVAVKSPAVEPGAEVVGKAPVPQPSAKPVAVPVYLDDIKELRFYNARNLLTKHGITKLPTGSVQKVRMNGVVQKHALSLVATSSGTSYVSYKLNRQYQTFRAFAGIYAPVKGDGLELSLKRNFKGVVASTLTFKVFGDGRLLWQSRPMIRCDSWEKCDVSTVGVDVLRLEIVCAGPANFGFSAWVQPRVLKMTSGGPGVDVAGKPPVTKQPPRAATKISRTPTRTKPKTTAPAKPAVSTPPAGNKLVPVSLASLLPAASRAPRSVPLLTSDGPAAKWFYFPTLGGWAMTPDNVTLIVSVPSKAEIVFLDTTTDKEIKRITTDFKPTKLAVQGETLYAAVEGGSILYALDMKTGAVKKQFKYQGEPVLNLVCHPRQGAVFFSDLGEKVFALDTTTGKITKTAGRGMFLSMDSRNGKFLYSGTNRPSKEYLEVTRGAGNTSRFRFVTVAERAAVLKYAVDGAKLKLVGGNANTAVGFGGFLHVSPDGKQFSMVAGGGWHSEKNQRIRHDIAIFGTKDMTTMMGGIKAGGPKRIAFHPVLNLGVAYGADYFYHFFNSRSLVAKYRRKIHGPQAVKFGSELLTFGGRGTRVIASQGGNVMFMPLELSDMERAALSKTYGSIPPAPRSLVTLQNESKGWKLYSLESWNRILPERNYGYEIKTLPQELKKGVILMRPRGESSGWIPSGSQLTMSRDGIVCVALAVKAPGKILVPEKDLQAIVAEGWKLTDTRFETTKGGADVWEWKVFAKPVKKGPVDLSLKTKIASKSYRVFMFR